MLSLKINRIIEEQNKTMYWLSKHTGIAPHQIAKICKGQTTRIEFETLEKICKVLNCSINDLFESDDPQMSRLLDYQLKLNELNSNPGNTQ